MIEGNASRAALKFLACALIAGFIILAVVAGYPAGFWKPFLYVVSGGVCIALLWPNQADGDALLGRNK